MAAATPTRVLIICFGAIGDVTRALPVAVRIKKKWPSVVLHWAVEPISRSILDHHPAIDAVRVFDRPGGFPAYCRFVTALRKEKYDLVLDMQRHLKSGVTSFCSGARRRIGFSRKNSREGNWLFNSEQVPASNHFSSKIQQFQKFADYLELPEMAPLDFGLAPRAEEVERIELLLSSYAAEHAFTLPPPEKRVALILGSTWPSRFWTADAYQNLITALHERLGILAILVGGAREKAFAQEVVPAGIGVVNLVERTSLRDLVPLFSRVRFAVGSDSGPMHIAAAVGTPVVSLWGSTSPLRSAPYASEKYVLQSPIGCSPCYMKTCPGLQTVCMSDIPWQAVYAHADRICSASFHRPSDAHSSNT